MTNRITQKQLDGAVLRLNKILNKPEVPYQKDEAGKFVSQVGNLHLYGAYGGWQLHEMVNSGGGIKVISSGGIVSKRELYNQIDAMYNAVYLIK